VSTTPQTNNEVKNIPKTNIQDNTLPKENNSTPKENPAPTTQETPEKKDEVQNNQE
jgi:hypothetical protein